MNAQVAFGFSVDQFLNPFTSKARKKLSRGYSLVENSRGGEGLMFPCANGKSEGVEGSYLRFPPWWGSGYFLEIHILSNYLQLPQDPEKTAHIRCGRFGFCFSLVEDSASLLCQSKPHNYFQQSFENCSTNVAELS